MKQFFIRILKPLLLKWEVDLWNKNLNNFYKTPRNICPRCKKREGVEREGRYRDKVCHHCYMDLTHLY